LRSLLATLVAAATALPSFAGTPAIVGPKALDWMVGYWIGDGDGTTMEEVWLPAAGECCGEMMIGVHRDVSQSGDVFYEFLRIEPVENGWAYVAKPSNQPEASFRLRTHGNQRVVFENLEHDYPQRITYERAGDVLTATISGTVNGEERSSSWTMRRARLEDGE
jgi:hypothetical protein